MIPEATATPMRGYYSLRPSTSSEAQSSPRWGTRWGPLSSRLAQDLTFPLCPPRWGTSPGSHRSGAQSCSSRSGQ